MLVQDYHFALLPRMIKEALPAATMIAFWHIPWPNPEAFAICPWREELLDGLLGSSILGFHTQFHCNNFLDTVDRLLEARVDREMFTVSCRGQLDRGQALSDLDRMAARPAGAAQSRSEQRTAEVRRAASACRRRTGSASASTGSTTRRASIERFNAGRRLLELEPRWVGRFTFIQIAAPTRAMIERVSRLRSARARDGRRDQLAALRGATFRRSFCSPSTRNRNRSTNTIAPPICASSAACTTG